MQKSSMRRNVFTVVGLYAVSFIVASGCPVAKSPSEKPAASTPKPIAASVSDNATVEDAGVVTAGADNITPHADQVETFASRESAREPALDFLEPATVEPPKEAKPIDVPAVIDEEPIQVAEAKPVKEPPAVEPTVRKPAAKDPPAKESAASKPGEDSVYGEFFEGWTKPKLVIVISGCQDGYLEPCGCAGLENQKGGISRRHTFIKQLAEKGWPLLAVDVGSLVRRYGKQAELQFAISAEALKKMGYKAVGFGPNDLRLSAGEIAAAVAGQEAGESMFVSANASVFGLTPKVQIIEESGMKIGVTSVLGDSYREKVNNTEIEMTSAMDALAEVAGELADCDFRILLAQATREECKEFAKRYPNFDVIVVAEGGDEPKNVPDMIPGTTTKLIEVGIKGMFCIVLGLYDKPKPIMKYQRVALDKRFGNSPEMKQLMTTYQEQLHDLGWSGIGLRPVTHPRTKAGVPGSGEFVGGESCKDCHTKAWDIWKDTGHAHATDSLVKADPPRQFDAECISCHATGWNPQEYFPFTTGYESLKTTPHLAANSCENCHGPGGAHVAAESGSDKSLQELQRDLMKLSQEEAKTGYCQKCHDHDNSPDFNFEEYWPMIEHAGKD